MVSSILAARQEEELHKAIIQYLEPRLKESTLQQIKNDLEVHDYNTPVMANYLEKKWSAVLRLQKRIMELEVETSNLRALVDANDGGSSNGPIGKSLKNGNWLPQAPLRLFKTQGKQLITALAIHPRLSQVAIGCANGSLIIWQVTNDSLSIADKIIPAHLKDIHRLVWSPRSVTLGSKEGYVLASCSSDLTIKLWDEDTYSQLRVFSGHEHTISGLAFLTNLVGDLYLYSASRDKTVKTWNISSGNSVRSFIGHSEWVRDVDAISVDSKLLLIDTSSNSVDQLGDFLLTCSNDQSARLTHAESGVGLAILIGHTHVVETAKFLPIHSNIYIDKYLEENPEVYPNIPRGASSDPTYINTLGFKYCITGGRDNTIKLWLLPVPTLHPHRSPTIGNPQAYLVVELLGHVSWVKSLCVHPNGKYIFSAGDDKTIRVWDLSTLSVGGKVRNIKTLKAHEGFINDIDFASCMGLEQEVALARKKGKTYANRSEEHEELEKIIELKMRHMFISGGVDNLVNFWG
ncbi:protein with putative role during mitosis [Scheffersomyces spartinae]|uniref:Nuclear distribution protein PAC1 n=1 Tax=Scheffersomyces spartinae TaxID=45513 RepID=A0A9P7VBX9_9ASCO|nr:protein with putative role during mitosis [Scheffersomyces spartinae]KAG7194975.1 protein with putative role during mitosis [Scheffersomyces spartinae]